MFNEIYGHKEVKSKVTMMLERKALSGSMLFYGPPSVGKRTTAFETARCALCFEEGREECTCLSCKRFPSNHPDFLSVGVQEKVKVGDVDRLLDFSFKVPFLSNRRIAIIDNADNITWSAANRLLKVIEEPPDHLLFILVSSEPDRMLATLRSRCIKVCFGKLSEENVINVIYQKLGFNATEARVLGWIASGSTIDIFPQAGMYLKQREKAREFLSRALSGSLLDLLDYISEIDKSQISPFVDMMMLLLSDILLLANQVDHIVNSDMREQLKKMSERFNTKGLLAATSALSQVKRYEYLNINVGTVLKSTLIRVHPYLKA